MQEGYWEFTEYLGTLLSLDLNNLREKIESAGLKSLGNDTESERLTLFALSRYKWSAPVTGPETVEVYNWS